MASLSVKIEGLFGILTIKLYDKNFSKLAFQFKLVLQGYKLFDHFDGTVVCPPKLMIHTELGVANVFLEWEATDITLRSLLSATLSNELIEHVLGCKTAHDVRVSLQDRYASISKAKVNTSKIEFKTVQKMGDTIDQYLSKHRNIKEQ